MSGYTEFKNPKSLYGGDDAIVSTLNNPEDGLFSVDSTPADFAVDFISAKKNHNMFYWFLGGRQRGMLYNPNIGFLLHNSSYEEMWVVRKFTPREKKMFGADLSLTQQFSIKDDHPLGRLNHCYFKVGNNNRSNYFGRTWIDFPDSKTTVKGFDFSGNLGPNAIWGTINNQSITIDTFQIPVVLSSGFLSLTLTSLNGPFTLTLLNPPIPSNQTIFKSTAWGYLDIDIGTPSGSIGFPAGLKSLTFRFESINKTNGTKLSGLYEVRGGNVNDVHPQTGGLPIISQNGTIITKSDISVTYNPRSFAQNPINGIGNYNPRKVTQCFPIF
jgi:hypothetical protein